jgi:hypothetical protein
MKRTIISLLIAAVAVTTMAAPAAAIETASMRATHYSYRNLPAETPWPELVARLRRIEGPGTEDTGKFAWKVERWRPLVAMYFPADRVDWALRIMRCESHGDPDAKNPHSSASGLFQHLARLWPGRASKAGFEGADVFDPVANIAVAAWLLEHGGTGNWVCKARK